MLPRVFLAAIVGFATLPATSHALTIATRGEESGPAVLDAYAWPFTGLTETPVQMAHWDGAADQLKARAAEAGWDLVQVGAEDLSAGCADGTFDKIDWSAVGGKDHYLSLGVSDCGVGASINNTVLAWDRDKFQAVPTWADFWDVAKIPGKRGLAKTVKGALEIALLADGVAPGELYKTLATNDGVDRAFRKLDQLKPYIVWWQTPNEAAKILGSGDVLMTTTPTSAIVRANRSEKHNFGVQFASSLYEPRFWAVVKGAPDARAATQFLYLAGAPAMEARLFRISGEAGLAKGANDFLTPDQQALSPTLPANMGGALKIDTGFWKENLGKLKARFDTWMTQ
jgi:putative spermidine/putrescine transport system substrate-binding protein